MNKKKKLLILSASAALLMGMLTACGKKEEGKATYTLHDATSGAPLHWAPGTWETNEDSVVPAYAESPLVDFVLSADKKGYTVIPEMAAALPKDVTAEMTDAEVKKYAVDTDVAGKKYTSGQKWEIKLNQAAKFADGTPINADTYVESMKRLLDPFMQNYRASDYATGQTAIANAIHYLHSEQTLCDLYWDGDGHAHAGTPAEDGWYFNPYVVNPWWGEMSFAALSEYVDATPEIKAVLADSAHFGTKSAPKNGRIDNDPELLDTVYKACGAVLGAFGLTASDLSKEFVEGDLDESAETYPMSSWCGRYYKYAKFDFDDVGIKKVDDYTFDIFFQSPVSEFNAKLFFAGNWLVKTDLWDKLRKPVADSALYSTTYGTSLDTYESYGPYKLSVFQADKEFDFVRNDNWYGYSDGNHEGQYQVDKLEFKIVQNVDTMLNMFRIGEIDSYALRGQDLDIFGSSSRLLYTPQTYTTKLTVNSVYDYLLELQKNDTLGNHTILSNLKFRKALSLGLDRKTLCQTETAGWRGFDVPINFMYVSDPDTGVAYRDTAQGKRVVTDNFGTEADGTPNYFGFDLAEARKLIDEAVEEEMASTREGHYAGGDVHLRWETYNEGWDSMVNWVIKAYENLVKGTKLEGKLKIERVITGSDYSDNIVAGKCDFGISTWGGAEFDPFGILECYTVASKMYEPYPLFADYLEINLKNGDWSANKGDLVKKGAAEADVVGMSLGGDGSGKAGWSYELNSGRYSAARADSVDTRLNILSACESYIVGTYNFISWGARQSVSLDSYRVQEGTDQYVQIVGFGGIRNLKLTKSDAEWSKWVKANLGTDGFIDYNK